MVYALQKQEECSSIQQYNLRHDHGTEECRDAVSLLREIRIAKRATLTKTEE